MGYVARMRRPPALARTLLIAAAALVVLGGCCLPGGGEPPAGAVTAAVTSAQPTLLASIGGDYAGTATLTLTNSTGTTLAGSIGFSVDEPSGYSANPVPNNQCATLVEGAGLTDGSSCTFDVAITALSSTAPNTANDVTVHLTIPGATVAPTGVVIHTTTVATA